MKVAIVADSHDRLDKVAALVADVNKLRIEYMIHCGDFVSALTFREFKKFDGEIFGVFGNNDGDKEMLMACFSEIGTIGADPQSIEIGGYRIFVTHRPELAREIAKFGSYDLVAFGHLHEIIVEREFTLTVSPGEICGWGTGRATYAVVDIAEKSVEIRDIWY